VFPKKKSILVSPKQKIVKDTISFAPPAGILWRTETHSGMDEWYPHKSEERLRKLYSRPEGKSGDPHMGTQTLLSSMI
jgi:hypothetical protein